MSSHSSARRKSTVAAALLDEPLAVGSRLGRYLIRGRLGQGGMGVVYRALNLDTGTDVALKTLHERDPVALYRLKREFRSLADVSHRNLVGLGELATAGGRPFFTMELVDGVDFRRWLELGPPRTDPAYFDRLRHGIRQIVTGLRALHGAGKVHCDLKPSNVLVAYDDRVVIVDLGLVRDRPTVAPETSGQLWGTAMYMAPEQARTPDVGAPADWYSLGVMLYAALAGQFPFQGNAMQILLAKQESVPPPPRTVAAGVPADLDHLCMALLRREPAARPGSAEILAQLGVGDHEAAGAIPRDTATHPLRSVFVGRRDELALLGSSLEQSRQRQCTVLLRGVSGVGKSSLVRHFLERADAAHDDAIVLAGRCYQRDSLPYRAVDSVIDSLSDFLRRRDQVELARLLPPHAALLGRLFPVLARVPAIADAAPPTRDLTDPVQLRAQVFTALRRLLSTLAERAPVIVFIDDFQWADADGLALLSELFHPPHAPRVMFLATVRTDAADDQLARWRQEQRNVIDLDLAPLPHADAEDLAEVLLQRMAPALIHNASAIAGEASGHPLLIDELVRRQGRSSAATGLDDAIWERLCNLETSQRALMSALAVAGMPLDLDAASLAIDASAVATRELARALEAERLLRSAPTPDGRLALEPYHDRIREVLVDRISDRARIGWHRRLAQVLLESNAGEKTPFNVLRHLTLAGEPQRAAALAVKAAHRAAASLAFEAAATLYRLAIQLGNHDRDTALGLQGELAQTLVNAGRGPEAATVLEQIAASADDPHTRADSLRRAAEQLLFTGHLERGRALLDSVASEYGVRIPATEIGTLTTLAWRRLHCWVRGTRWQPRTEDQVPPRDIVAQDVHHSVGTILAMFDPLRGMALLSKASIMAFRLGVLDRAVRALTTEALYSAGAGAPERATALLERAAREARAVDDVGLRIWLEGAGAIVSYLTGNFADVIPTVDRALLQFASIDREQRARLSTGGAFEITVLRHYRMTSLAHLGRCNELRSEFHDVIRDARRRGDRLAEANTAHRFNLVWLFDDRPDQAKDELAASAWMASRDSFQIPDLSMLYSAAQIHLYGGTAATAREELAGLIARSKRAPLLRMAPLRAQRDFIVGRLAVAEAEAQPARARRHHRQALAAARRLERLRLPQSVSAASLLRASVAFQRGDHERAATQLLLAERSAGQAGLRMLEAAARRRRGELFGGSLGEALIHSVDAWATGEGICSPAKVTRMMAPGFDRRR